MEASDRERNGSHAIPMIRCASRVDGEQKQASTRHPPNNGPARQPHQPA